MRCGKRAKSPRQSRTPMLSLKAQCGTHAASNSAIWPDHEPPESQPFLAPQSAPRRRQASTRGRRSQHHAGRRARACQFANVGGLGARSRLNAPARLVGLPHSDRPGALGGYAGLTPPSEIPSQRKRSCGSGLGAGVGKMDPPGGAGRAGQGACQLRPALAARPRFVALRGRAEGDGALAPPPSGRSDVVCGQGAGASWSLGAAEWRLTQSCSACSRRLCVSAWTSQGRGVGSRSA